MVTVLVVAFGVVFGVAWYFSGVALAVVQDPVPPVTVEAIEDGDLIRLPDTESTTNEGLHAVRHPDGWGIMAGFAGGGPGIVREWRDVEGVLAGAPVDGVVDSDVFVGDPSAVDLEFDEVTVTSDVGELPTWFVPAAEGADPAAGATWVVFAHGRGGSREEALRYLPVWHDLGHPVLVPSYRNDAVAPPAPDNRYGLGETEWRDVDAAVEYALANGADEIVLAGWSMGGAIVLQLLDRSEHADAVTGVVLDAPVLDWDDVLRYQGSQVGLPGWWSGLAVRLVELRGGLDFADFDWVDRAAELPDDVPILLVHSDRDEFVPNGPSVALAEERPDIVTLITDYTADHTREWNVDPDRYDADMRDWFDAEIR